MTAFDAAGGRAGILTVILPSGIGTVGVEMGGRDCGLAGTSMFALRKEGGGGREGAVLMEIIEVDEAIITVAGECGGGGEVATRRDV